MERALRLSNRIASTHRAKIWILLFSLLSLLLLGFLVFNTVRLNNITVKTEMTDDYLLKCNQAGDLLHRFTGILLKPVTIDKLFRLFN